jgi:hypothetical protein
MKILKQILGVIWPIVYEQLVKLAEKTETPWDNVAVQTANSVLRAWLDNEFEEDN